MKKIIVLLVLFSFTFGQDISYNEEFQVNSHTEDKQRNPSITETSDNKFVVCWQSYGQDGSGYGIYAQIFDDLGQKVGDEFQVNSYTEGWQQRPSITNLSDDKFVICWETNQDGDIYRIFAQIFDDQGQKIGEEFRVNSYTENDQSRPSITNISDSLAICWQSFLQDSDDRGIFAQILNDQGQKVGDEFQVNSYTEEWQQRPSITNLSENKFVVCWNRSGSGIVGQIFDDKSQKIGDEFQVKSYFDPSITNLSDSQFVVCCESSGNKIFAQIFNDQGQKVGDGFQVNSYTEGYQQRPSITNLSENKFVVCWENWDGPLDGNRIFAQIFNRQGQKIGNNFQVNFFTEDRKIHPSITNLSNNKFVVCWESDNHDGAKWDVYAKYYLNNPVHHTLQDFNYISPQMDATVNDLTPKFIWKKGHNSHLNFPWDVTYDLYISKNQDFQNPITYTEISDTTFEIPDTLETDQTYYWKVQAVNWNYDSLWSSDVNGFYVSEDAENTAIKDKHTNNPTKFKLHQNHPNPFNPTTTISYSLPKNTSVKLTIYNINGRKIKTPVNEYQNKGKHEINFNAKGLASGLYIYKLQVKNEYSETKKMLYLK